MFKFEETKIKGVWIIHPQIFIDNRGSFMETYKKDEFVAHGIDKDFVQDNQSSSSKGVLRGLHFQKEHTQGKLVRVTEGTVFDVAVDLRPSSETFGKWVGVTLSAKEGNQLYIPEGFAHGFLVLSETAKFVYKCTDTYHKESEGGIPWNDPDIGIEWPHFGEPLRSDLEGDLLVYKFSQKDENYLNFEDQSFEWADKYL